MRPTGAGSGQQCGAEHTIPAEKMSQRCRFCGSTQVMLSDSLGSFRQPDGLLPFFINEAGARESIDKQLKNVAASPYAVTCCDTVN